ncbi:MAG: hypothetical protein HY456_00720 [Parcubacteria group bacterium]|nr:hypothetical protein [Parcubacteria group bacterium]
MIEKSKIEANKAELAYVSQEIDWLRKKYPAFNQVDIRTTSDRLFEGGAFNAPDEGNHRSRPEIEIGRGGPEQFALLKKTREAAVRAMAELLQIPFEQIDGAAIQRFIFFHEAGHADDFLEHYYRAAGTAWKQKSDAEMMTLPLPGFAPAEIQEAIKAAGSFDAWRTKDQYIAEWCDSNNITDADQLIAVQENAYRKLPKESFADRFAVEAMSSFLSGK